MGGVSSVYIRPTSSLPPSDDGPERTISGTDCPEEAGGNEVVQWRLTEAVPGGPIGGGVLEVRLPTEGSRETDLGRTIQFLAEENVRLRHKNADLKALLRDVQEPVIVQPDIPNETPEQKILRLERTLAAERKEKWEAIENSEKYRVELVNCQKYLAKQLSDRENMEEALENSKRQIQNLEMKIKRLKNYQEDESKRSEISLIGNGEESEELHLSESREVAQAEATDEICAVTERLQESQNSEEILENAGQNLPRERSDLEAFRSQMLVLREARQKAISAKAQEMNQLREELAKEKAERKRLERRLAPNQVEKSPTDLQTENLNLMQQVEDLKIELVPVISLKEQNQKLVDLTQQLKRQVSELSTTVRQQQGDLSEARRKYDRLSREQASTESERSRSDVKIREIEEEQKRMWEEYDNEKQEIAKRTAALKEVISISRQMLLIREKQVTDLKQKLTDIEESIAERNRLEGTDLKVEYERQLENIKVLKELYEERVQLLEAERAKLTEKIADDAKAMEQVKSELSDLTLKYEMASEEADAEKQRSLALTVDLSGWAAQARSCQRELAAMNGLLTQMLLNPSPEDLDRLAEQLQQNHALIAQITTCEDCSDVAAALPKMLLDLMAQVEEGERRERVIALEAAAGSMPSRVPDPMTDSTDTISEQSEGLIADTAGAVLPVVSYKNATVFKVAEPTPDDITNPVLGDVTEPLEDLEVAESIGTPTNMDPAVQDIVTNLPKVWKVLTELLSHHSLPERMPEERTCYKSVETPSGPRSEISVSNTFIRLKELILEKKSLTRELCRLKHLNSHLETRLDDQEKRLSIVQSELHKTWGVVGRMRAQHQQLHNHEKILRYELQEKRVMLSELKQELEYCRDKWERARRKNNESETECRKLRKEFAARKVRDALWGAGRGEGMDSGESGFSDEQNESAEELDHCDADRSSTPSPVDFRPTQCALDVAEAAESDPRCSNVGITVSGDGTVVVTCDMVPEGARREVPYPTSLVEGVEGQQSLTETVMSEPAGDQVTEDQNEEPNTSLEKNLTVQETAVEASASESDVVAEDVREQIQPTLELPVAFPVVEQIADTSSASTQVDVSTKEPPPEQPSIENTSFLASESQAPLEEVLQQQKTAEEMTEEERERARDARALRLQRLEEQCQLLVRKVDITTHKSNFLSNRLEELHDHYGGPGASTQSQSEDIKGCSSSANKKENKSDVEKGSTEEEVSEISDVVEKVLEDSQKEEDIENHAISTENTSILQNTGTSTAPNVLPELISEDSSGGTTAPTPPPLPSTVVARDPINIPKSTQEESSSVALSSEQPPRTEPERDFSLATFDERMAARAARLQRLEEQCSSLFGKVSSTVGRGNELSARLQEIHEECVRSESARELESLPDRSSEISPEDSVLSLADRLDSSPSSTNEPPIPPPMPGTALVIPSVSGEQPLLPISLPATFDEQVASSSLKRPPTPPPMPPTLVVTPTPVKVHLIGGKIDSARGEQPSLPSRSDTPPFGGRMPPNSPASKPEEEFEEQPLQPVQPSSNAELPTSLSVPATSEIKSSSLATTSTSEGTESTPSGSGVRDISLATFDERMAARAARLQRLEEQCSSLFGKVSSTVDRSNELSARMQEIHEECVTAESRLTAPAFQSETHDSESLTNEATESAQTNENSDKLTNSDKLPPQDRNDSSAQPDNESG